MTICSYRSGDYSSVLYIALAELLWISVGGVHNTYRSWKKAWPLLCKYSIRGLLVWFTWCKSSSKSTIFITSDAHIIICWSELEGSKHACGTGCFDNGASSPSLSLCSVSRLHDYRRESTCMIYFASNIALRRFPEVVTVLAPRFLN